MDGWVEQSDAAYDNKKPQIVEYPETSLKWRSYKNQLLLNHMQMQVTELETVNKAELFLYEIWTARKLELNAQMSDGRIYGYMLQLHM